MKTSARCWVLGIAAACLGGCVRNQYTIDLKPVPSGLERTVQVQRPGASDQKSSDPPTKSVIVGATPSDVGGAGSYATYPSDLGTLHVFIERFRGNDDLVGQWERQHQAIDVWVDLLLNWIDARLSRERGVSKLRAFVDKDLRRDLKNGAMYARLGFERLRAWPAQSGGTPEAELRLQTDLEEFASRIALYAAEHGYITHSEIPRALHAFNSSQDHGRAWMALVRRFMLRTMGRDPNDPSFAPAALSESDAWSAAFRQRIKESSRAQERLASWARKARPSLERESLDEQLRQLSAAAVRPPIFIPADIAKVRLDCPEPPISTNGTWDPSANQLTWSIGMEINPEDATGLPPIAFASWCVPDAEAQTRHLGTICVQDEALASYCLWVDGLTAADAQQWRGWLSSRAPGAELIDSLLAFRFAGHEQDPAAPEGPTLLAQALKAGSLPRD